MGVKVKTYITLVFDTTKSNGNFFKCNQMGVKVKTYAPHSHVLVDYTHSIESAVDAKKFPCDLSSDHSQFHAYNLHKL